MGQNFTKSDTFLQEAVTSLTNIEQTLTRLAEQTLHLPPPAATDNATTAPQIISQHLLRLSERTQTIKQYLNQDGNLPPPTDEHWPLIRVLQSQEEEQIQLARELENLTGQLLANAIFELASCRHLLDRDNAALADGLASLQTELEQGLADMRWFISGLEPATILGNFGLSGGLRRYLEVYENRTNLTATLHVKANIGRLPRIVETAIFRIVQEALSNVERHAQASQVEVVIGADDENLHFSITDDGRGVTVEQMSQSRKNFGLARMVDYAELLNGSLKILSDVNQGTKVDLTVPYPKL